MALTTRQGRARYEFDEFCAYLAESLGISSEELSATTGPIVTGLSLDELSFAQLVLAIQTLNPCFQIPDQMDVHQIELADLYHYYRIMDEGHVEREAQR